MRGTTILAALAVAGLTIGFTAGQAIADPRSPDRSQDVSVEPSFTPDPLAGSTPSKPSRGVEGVAAAKAKQQKLTAELALDLSTARSDGYSLYQIPSSRLAWRDEAAPRTDPGVVDSTGVRMFRFAGTTKLWNHPVGQSQWGLQNLTTYYTTGDRFYLDRAIKQAQRNLDRKVESRGAWWYPYDFDVARCAGAPAMKAPWYSAMSQGMMLALFVRLNEITGDAKWREAADRTFNSLTLAPDAAGPWATWVDGSGYLWLEEYPQPTMTGERVMNGHIFAIYGAYDYWRLTKSAAAADIVRSAATTVRKYMPDPIRLASWGSRYSIGCLNSHFGYHIVHTGQSLRLYEMTHAGAFANYASTLRGDYPGWGVRGTVRFQAGTHVGYGFDVNGKITKSKSMTLGRASNAPTEKRIRIKGRGIYYLITAGPLYGYLVPESFPARVLLGKTVEQRYVTKRTLTFKAGTYTAYAYDSRGYVIASKIGRFTTSTSTPLAATAVVNGRLSYLASSGYFKGWWMPATSGHSVR